LRRSPLGLVWDSRNWSCGYDATFTILGNIWTENTAKWTANFAYMSSYLGNFAVGLQSTTEGRVSFERVRDAIRQGMHAAQPEHFPYGHSTTSIDRIAQTILPS
ncbi:hypothetical protein B0H16DRAFT_1243779, partial [Mycena metata]